MAKIITSGFFGVFSRTVFHVLQSDSTQFKPSSPKKRQRHSTDSFTPHSQHELNPLRIRFENFYKKFSSSLLLYTIIQMKEILLLYHLLFINAMRHKLTLARNQIFNSYTFTLFHLISVNIHVEFLSHGILWTKIPTIKKFQKNFFISFQVLVFNIFFVFVTPIHFPLTKKEAHQFPQMTILQHTTSS